MKRLCSPVPSNPLCTALIAGALCLSPISHALAASTGSAAPADESITDRAVAAFEAGNFDEAIDLFNQAYEADKDPNYLFNIGRVYEEKGDLRGAIDQYQKFVNSAGVDLESRKFANERLKVLRDIVAAEDAAKAEEERRLAEEQAAKDAANNPNSGEGAADDGSAEDAMAKQRRTRIIGYSLIGTGAAVAIGGVVFGVLAQGKQDDFLAETNHEVADNLQATGRRYATAADAMYITGGVVAVVGAVVTLTTLNKGKSQKTARTRFQPHFGRTGVGASLTHRF